MADVASDDQRRILVESHRLFLTHPKIVPRLSEAAGKGNRYVGLETIDRQSIWKADGSSVRESSTDMENLVLVFQEKVVVGEFEGNVRKKMNAPFALAYSMGHFRRPTDLYPTAPGAVDARESGEAPPVPEGSPEAPVAPPADIPEGAFEIEKVDNAPLLFNPDGSEYKYAPQERPDGNYKFIRFSIITTTKEGTAAYVYFEIRGNTDAEIAEKLQKFRTEDITKY
jgi:hypothetical protein